MMFPGDSEGRPLKGKTRAIQTDIDAKVLSVLESASHCHFNCDFRFNSQSTAMQFTDKKTIGGRAWLSIGLSSPDHEKALVLWANTSLGLILQWWHANKQQPGRGCIGKSALKTMPILDVTALTTKQLEEAVNIFDAVCMKPLMPLHDLGNDQVRREIDEKFGRKVLGLSKQILAAGGPLELVRTKLGREPSIRGSK